MRDNGWAGGESHPCECAWGGGDQSPPQGFLQEQARVGSGPLLDLSAYVRSGAVNATTFPAASYAGSCSL